MKNLFDAVKLNRLELRNRIFRSATWEALADAEGNLTAPLYEIYSELAKGGVGAIVTGITTISPHDNLLEGIVQFHSDKFIPQHQKLTAAAHEHGAKIFLQAAIVDSVFYIGGELCQIPIAKLSAENISEVVELFQKAALRAESAGYDGIQIHAAHFFFLSKFISPLFNPNKNRAEILGEILDAIRKVCGKTFCVTAKINGDDFTQGGLKISDCIAACEIMKLHGIDSAEISGNYTSRDAKVFVSEGYFKEFAVAVKNSLPDLKIILVGGHRSFEEMTKILNETAIEFLSMSRPLIREPNLINRWQRGDLKPSACVSCNACYNTPAHKCIFNLKRKF